MLFCTMLAWFLSEMRRVEGARRHGSPSTCTGTVLKVVRVTSLHWCSLSPWPPTCSAAYRPEGEVRVSVRSAVSCRRTVSVPWRPLTREAMVKPMTSMQPSSCRCGSKSRWSPVLPQGMVPAQYLRAGMEFVHVACTGNVAVKECSVDCTSNGPLHYTPGNVQEDDALELQLLDLGRKVCAVTLRSQGQGEGGREMRGEEEMRDRSKEGAHSNHFIFPCSFF